MAEPSPQAPGDKLRRLLGDDPQVADERLERLRSKLIHRFAAARCADPEDLAQKTICRVLEALEKGKQITTQIEHYAAGVATNIIREQWKTSPQRLVPIEELRPDQEPCTEPFDRLLTQLSEDQVLSGCLQSCLAGLAQAERELLVEYYATSDDLLAKDIRERMAGSLRLTRDQLRRRAFNLRRRLEVCMNQCLGRNTSKKIS